MTAATLRGPIRRQLTLFLPPEQQAVIEPIRLKLDPRQHAIIQAHVTLCRDEDLDHWPEHHQHLASLEPFSLTMRFGGPEIMPDGCVLLRPTQGAEQYQTLRQKILGSSARAHGAHITLLHPRSSNGITYDLENIARATAGLEVTFHTICLIEQLGSSAWRVRQQYGAAN